MENYHSISRHTHTRARASLTNSQAAREQKKREQVDERATKGKPSPACVHAYFTYINLRLFKVWYLALALFLVGIPPSALFLHGPAVLLGLPPPLFLRLLPLLLLSGQLLHRLLRLLSFFGLVSGGAAESAGRGGRDEGK